MSDFERLDFKAEEADIDIRIDKYLASVNSDYSRSYIQKLINDSQVLVNDNVVKSNYKLKNGDIISVIIPKHLEDSKIEPEDIALDIIYEDNDILIVNKPKGMVVHPACGHENHTLVNAIMYHCDDLSGINGEERPGIVHRIDRDTTGSLIICKNDIAHRFIAEQIAVHSINRIYEGIVFGNIKDDEGVIHTKIARSKTDRKKMAVCTENGREAITHYYVLERFKGYTYVRFKLETGRTHQIRVHMAHIHHPLLGDTVYGPDKQPFKLEGQTLHAKTIGFIHPSTKEYVEFSAPLPDYFLELLNKLRRT